MVLGKPLNLVGKPKGNKGGTHYELVPNPRTRGMTPVSLQILDTCNYSSVRPYLPLPFANVFSSVGLGL